MPDRDKITAGDVLESYQAAGTQLFFIGLFNRGVTVLSQQIRALNLAWALVESKTIACLPVSGSDTDSSRPSSVAIIGGGFAGLTLASGLLKKRANVKITLFEQRDTLLPMQQGSDSRWLHPRIYDWPSEGSEASAAMLPLLNWTAARASDVVVQVLTEWRSIVEEATPRVVLNLYCNTRHLQVHRPNVRDRLRIEWVGEHRDAKDGTITKIGRTSEGRLEDFDVVVLAIGFGPEQHNALSYWRNETLAQPSLEQARITYLVSGQGDGAMIDLLRLRISQFRQDRILSELFEGADALLTEFRELHAHYGTRPPKEGLFDALEKLEVNYKEPFDEVRNRLTRRLRRDTDVVLQLKVRTFSQLFEPGPGRISFQNRLLVYLLYKCGGFSPSHVESDEVLMRQHGIAADRVIRRHGPSPKPYLQSVLSEELFRLVVPDDSSGDMLAQQSDELRWPGGYFGFPGPSDAATTLPDELRAWQREYLPGPTELLAQAFCATIAGMFVGRHQSGGRLRVTLHRVAVFGSDERLQQACDYVGTNIEIGPRSSGRVFPVGNATIGVAYRCRRIVRSVRDVEPVALNGAMQRLNLNNASRRMSTGVGFVLAVPILAPTSGMGDRVIGVVYLDSTADRFFIDEDELNTIASGAFTLFQSVINQKSFERIANTPIAGLSDTVHAPEPLPSEAAGYLELVSSVDPPRLGVPFYLNLEYADFIRV